jgi:hypothetical protein
VCVATGDRPMRVNHRRVNYVIFGDVADRRQKRPLTSASAAGLTRGREGTEPVCSLSAAPHGPAKTFLSKCPEKIKRRRQTVGGLPNSQPAPGGEASAALASKHAASSSTSPHPTHSPQEVGHGSSPIIIIIISLLTRCPRQSARFKEWGSRSLVEACWEEKSGRHQLRASHNSAEI